MLRGLLIAGLVSLLWPQPPRPATPTNATPPLGTDIHELVFDGLLETLRKAVPRPIAVERGYENQPFYTPDGAAILFTANRDGKQTDIYEFDRKARRVRPLLATPESEYSATVTPDGKGFSAIRVEADGTQRLWRFDRDGGNPRPVLTEIKPVGYHAWIDAEELLLFVLGPPATLQRARVATGKAEVITKEIGRSLQRVAGGRLISFVQREPSGEYWVKQFDPSSGAVTTLVQAVAGSAERDCAWLPDGTLLMSAGQKVFAWHASRAAEAWREVFDGTPHKLGAVTRMAASAEGRMLAIVVNEAQKDPH